MARKHMAPPEAKTSAAYGRSRPLYPGAQNILPSWPRPFVPTGVTSAHRPACAPAREPSFKREASASGKEQWLGYRLIPDPAQHEKIRRRMPPWSPPEQSPFRSRASSITRTLTFCNPRQRKISLSPAFPGLACRGRMPRFLPVPQSNLLRAVGYGQSEENRKRSAKA